MIKIGLWGYYGFDNFGDDLILQTLIGQFSRSAPCRDPLSITVFSQKNELKPLRGNHIRAAIVPRSAKALLSAAFSLDILVIGPGGLFPHKNFFKLAFFAFCAAVLRARKRTFALYGLGIGCGNFRSHALRPVLFLLFHLSRPIVLRQRISSNLPEWVYRDAGIVESYDFLLTDASLLNHWHPRKEAGRRPSIAVCLANVFPSDAGLEVRKAFADSMVRNLRWLQCCGYDLAFFSLSSMGDEALNREIMAQMDSKSCTHMAYGAVDCPAVLDAFCKTSLVIAMRFHALVTATMIGVPVYSIAYSEKTEDLCESLGISEYCQRVCFSSREYYGKRIDLDAELMQRKIRHLLSHGSEIAGAAQQRLVDVREKASHQYESALREMFRKS